MIDAAATIRSIIPACRTVNLKFDAQGSYGGRGGREKRHRTVWLKDGLYNIEAVKLTDFKDNVTFNDRVLTPATRSEVNLARLQRDSLRTRLYHCAGGARRRIISA